MSDAKPKPDTKGSAIEVFVTFLKLGMTSFGGPIAHLGYFRNELVERQAWVSESQYSLLLAICQFLPGPASSQLGFALGLLRAGWLGAFAAFLAFTLPSAILFFCFAFALPFLSGEIGDAAINGLKIVACAVVADAVLGMSKKLCPDTLRRSIAILVVGISLLVDSVWSQILVVLLGAIVGVFFCQSHPADNKEHIHVTYSRRSGFMLFAIFILLLLVFVSLPTHGGLLGIVDSFYQAGALVFGGGHVVLPLLEESVVASGWVTKESFLAGYGAAQAVPGPMFAFSAYLGAIIPTEYSPWLSASVALVFMFLPGFLLVTAALPLWQSISHFPQVANAIAGVNAAVVGLLGAALYDPIFTEGIRSGIDLAIGVVAFGLLTIWRLSPLFVVFWCVTASMLLEIV